MHAEPAAARGAPGAAAAGRGRGLLLAFALAGTLAAALLATVWTLPVERLVQQFLWDDSFYYLQTARHAAAGLGPTFDGRNLTNGFHPLWMLILIPICTAAGNHTDLVLRAALTFQVVACLVPSFVLAWLIARRGAGATAAWVTMAAALALLPSRHVDGMESGVLVVLGMVLAHQLAFRDPPGVPAGARTRAVTGLLLGLLFLARTDGVFLVAAWGVVTAVAAWRNPAGGSRARALLASTVPAALPCLAVAAPYLLWNRIVFGSFVPISGTIKFALAETAWPAQPFSTVVRVMLALIAAGWIAEAAAALRRARAQAPAPPLAGPILVFGLYALLHALFTQLEARWGVFPWHFYLSVVPFLLVTARIAGAADGALRARFGRPAGWVMGAACVLLVAGALGKTLWRFGATHESFTGASYRAALWTHAHLPPGTRVGMKDAGAYGYFMDGGVTNLDGVINNFEYQRYLAEGRLADYLRDQGITHLAQHALARFPEAERGSYDSLAYTIPIYPRGGTLVLRRSDEVYRAPYERDPVSWFVIWRLPGAAPDQSPR